MADFPQLSSRAQICYPGQESPVDPTISNDMEAGYTVTRAGFTRDISEWTLVIPAATPADKAIFKAFVSSVRVGSDYFNWTNPEDDQVYIVRFKGPPKYTYVNFDQDQIDFTLAQV